MNKRKIGSWYETLACKYIVSMGGKIIARNFRVRRGEIDIIALDGDYTCFVEVKYRNGNKYGGPEAAVSFRKQKQICNISRYYMCSNNMSDEAYVRYDVITVSGEDDGVVITWYKNAFDYIY